MLEVPDLEKVLEEAEKGTDKMLPEKKSRSCDIPA